MMRGFGIHVRLSVFSTAQSDATVDRFAMHAVIRHRPTGRLLAAVLMTASSGAPPRRPAFESLRLASALHPADEDLRPQRGCQQPMAA